MQPSAAPPERCLSAAGGLESSLPILPIPHWCGSSSDFFFFLFTLVQAGHGPVQMHLSLTVLEKGFLHCFSLGK